MKKIIVFVVLVALAIAVVECMAYHFVRSEDGWEIFKKEKWGWPDTVVDVRDWTAADWIQHEDLAIAMERAEAEKLLADQERAERAKDLEEEIGDDAGALGERLERFRKPE